MQITAIEVQKELDRLVEHRSRVLAELNATDGAIIANQNWLATLMKEEEPPKSDAVAETKPATEKGQ